MTRDSVNFLEAEWGVGPARGIFAGILLLVKKGHAWMEMAGQMKLPDNRRKRVG